jgi:hypothetical protein
VTEISTDRRVAELRALQQTDPRALIDLYCRITGEIPTSQMPAGASFSRMIDLILEREALELARREATA